MEVGLSCRHALAVENEVLGGSMSNQYSIFDDCFVDSFAGGGGASTGIEKEEFMGYKNIEDRRAYHREYMKERRAWLRSHHMCTECGKQDARTLIGKMRCFDCLEKHRGHPLPEFIIKDTKSHIPRGQRFDFGECYICGKKLDGQKRSDGEESHLCKKCYEIRKHPPRIRRLKPPCCDTPNAWEVYLKLKAENESANLGRSTPMIGK